MTNTTIPLGGTSISHEILLDQRIDSAGYHEDPNNVFSRHHEPDNVSLCPSCRTTLGSPPVVEELDRFALDFKLTPTVRDLVISSYNGCAMCRLVYYMLLFAREGYYRPLLLGSIGTPLKITFAAYRTRWNWDSLRFSLGSYKGQSENLVAFTEDDDSSVGFTAASPRSFLEVVKTWVSECDTTHVMCSSRTCSDTWLPTRVLETLSDAGEPRLRLLETGERMGQYAALSYCWGCEQPLKLTSARLTEYMHRMPEESLPRSVRDAVYVCRSLGIKYLWIDAYCIIQDCEEDKATEIGQMNIVFKNAYLTIEASGASSAADGFLGRVAETRSWPLPLRLPHGDWATFYLRHYPNDVSPGEEFEPIHKRAWTLQERYLSSRVLSFPSNGAMILWHCKHFSRNEHGHIPLRTDLSVHRVMDWGEIVPKYDVGDEFLGIWGGIVAEYSPRQLSVPSDKLPAIGGIAAEFHRAWGGEYFCGLWGNWLPPELLWVRRGRAVRSSVYRAPTWSWACLDGDVFANQDPGSESNVLEILDVSVNLVSKLNPFGPIRNAKLRVRGLLKSGMIRNISGFGFGTLKGAHDGARLGSAHLDDSGIEQIDEEVWCLAFYIPKFYDEFRDRDTEDPENPPERNGLLLVKSDALSCTNSAAPELIYRRIGTYTDNGWLGWDGWHDGNQRTEITIV